MTGLAAGRLNQRITIRRSVDLDDGRGGQSAVWSTIASVWAEVINLNGREAVLAGALQGISSWRITIRWRAGVLPSDQIVHGDLHLNVTAADDPDGQRDRLVIFADNQAVQAD